MTTPAGRKSADCSIAREQPRDIGTLRGMNHRATPIIVGLILLTIAMPIMAWKLHYAFEYQVGALIGSLLFIAAAVAIAVERRT